MLQQNEGVSQKQRETWMTPASQAGLEWAGEEIPGENSWFRRIGSRESLMGLKMWKEGKGVLNSA